MTKHVIVMQFCMFITITQMVHASEDNSWVLVTSENDKSSTTAETQRLTTPKQNTATALLQQFGQKAQENHQASQHRQQTMLSDQQKILKEMENLSAAFRGLTTIVAQRIPEAPQSLISTTGPVIPTRADYLKALIQAKTEHPAPTTTQTATEERRYAEALLRQTIQMQEKKIKELRAKEITANSGQRSSTPSGRWIFVPDEHLSKR